MTEENRYTKDDLSQAFEDIHSGNLVIGMYVDDLQKQLQRKEEDIQRKTRELLSQEKIINRLLKQNTEIQHQRRISDRNGRRSGKVF